MPEYARRHQRYTHWRGLTSCALWMMAMLLLVPSLPFETRPLAGLGPPSAFLLMSVMLAVRSLRVEGFVARGFAMCAITWDLMAIVWLLVRSYSL